MRKTLLLSVLMMTAVSVSAQDAPAEEPVESGRKMNIVKMNLPALALGNFSFQYERVLNKRFSAALGFSTRPMSNLPFNDQISDAVGGEDEEDDDVKDLIKNTKIGTMAITPEIRWYLGKGYGKGFYVAPYYRYSKFNTEDIVVNYTDDANQEQDFRLSGDVVAHSGGLMFGAQWNLSKHISLDWWIVGAHFGSGTGTITGRSSVPLSQDEQDQITEELEDVELPSGDLEVRWSADGRRASTKIDGPWLGLRAGIALGYRF